MGFGMPRTWLRASAVAAALALPAFAVVAQQLPPVARPPQGAVKPAVPPAAPGGADAGLQRRVEQLEEQLVDMQVTIGTLESLARGGAAPSPGGQMSGAALSASDAGRLDALETQIRAMAAQLENLQDQVRNFSAGRGGGPAPGGGFGAVTVAPEASKD